jgi:hypothetical protein
MRGLPRDECDPERQLLESERLALEIFRREEGRQRLDRHLAALPEAAPEDLFCRLVVEDEVAGSVDDERRRRELRGKLAREDENQVLLSPSLIDGGSVGEVAR